MRCHVGTWLPLQGESQQLLVPTVQHLLTAHSRSPPGCSPGPSLGVTGQAPSVSPSIKWEQVPPPRVQLAAIQDLHPAPGVGTPNMPAPLLTHQLWCSTLPSTFFLSLSFFLLKNYWLNTLGQCYALWVTTVRKGNVFMERMGQVHKERRTQ